ncbi:MAG: elongation factor P, partial [Clostridiales bacterium]|nr:elongation factor P [Clostridiales bacterium]
ELYYFMDPETYDQIPLSADQVEEAMKYLRENDEATIKFYKGNAFLVEAPNFVDLVVTETEPGVKGDTATNVTKDATVETGAVVKVPIFIEEGERIQIDTRTGEYLGRSK